MLIDSVYNFLVSQGLSESAKTLAKEGKVNEKKAKTADVPALVDVFTTYKRPNEATNGAAAKRAKVEDATSDSESSSDSSSSEDEKPVAKKAAAAAPAPAAKKAAPVAKKAESSSDSDSSSSEDEKPVAKKAAAAPAPAAKKAAPVAKKADSDSSSSDSDSDSEDDKKKKPTGVVATKGNTLVVSVPAKKAAPVQDDDSSSDSSSSSDSDSEDEKPKKPAAKSTPAKAEAAAPSAPATPSGGSSDVHKCVVKGLPWKTTEKELADFFKTCGKPNSCEIPLGDDGRSSGVGYVKFATRAELDAALALDGQYWPGTERWLKITEGVEKVRPSFQPGVKPEGCDTVFVGNLPWDVDEDIMRNTFGSCGEVINVRFATAEDGSFKGFGHVQFADGDSTEAAVGLAGTMVNGRPIRVDYAPPRQRAEGGGGRGGGGRGDRSPGGFGGRSPGGRGGRGDGGRGGRGGRGAPAGGNRSKGTIAAAPGGKKMTFGDDE
jgi:nucleolin